MLTHIFFMHEAAFHIYLISSHTEMFFLLKSFQFSFDK